MDTLKTSSYEPVKYLVYYLFNYTTKWPENQGDDLSDLNATCGQNHDNADDMTLNQQACH